jgi:pyruvate-ferredoxin/flavodoxin oxidoreductase
MRSLINDDLVRAHRKRALSPDRPFIRGTAQNPDVFFQARETVNSYYLTCPDMVQKVMDKFEKVVGRRYELFQYFGAEDAERIMVLMGSGAETVEETVEYLMKQGEKVGLIKVRLYRPFSVKHFINSLPVTIKIISTLDRTKEPGSIGEPLYTDIVTAIQEGVSMGISHFKDTPKIIGGRYGLSSKEFTPAMIKGLFDEMKKDIPKNHFTIGINDDLTYTSISYNPDFSIEPTDRTRAVFYGLGSDGTVGANKNSIKIIGEETDNYAQGYFVYDSRKAGSLTISHLRFGPTPIHSTYLVNRANFVACHQFSFLERYDVLKTAQPGAVFLLNSPYSAEEVWDHLPYSIQQTIIEKKLRFFVIDAFKIAKEVGLGVRINTIMQVCFFSLSKVIPIEKAIKAIKHSIEETYGQKGEKIVNTNFAGVDNALTNLYEVKVPDKATRKLSERSPIPLEAPEFVKKVTAKIIAEQGDDLPVSVFSPDGTFPSGTTQWEKRNIAQEIPSWDPNTCIQCGKCVMVCPHAVIRAKVYDPKLLSSAPHSFKSVDPKNSQFKGMKFTLQVSPEDCTGCVLCVEDCPAKNKTNPNLKAINMVTQPPIREQEVKNWEFFLEIPEVDRKELKLNAVRNVQYLQPLFEFSGACAGCGETPYVKLLSQLFGDRAVIANATGCSSIYGGNLPTTPWTFNKEGRGPAWSNSLFEDNAEFGLGMRLALDKQVEYAFELVDRLSSEIGDDLVKEIKNADQSTERGLQEQRDRIKVLEKKLKKIEKVEAKDLLSLIDVLAKKSVWIVGGDGWAYDIGYGGLDHVIAQRRKVNILVLDSETYSNTGGQMSKATPLGAIAKFAAGGKRTYKKDLAMMAISYGDVYVARVAMGANDAQVIKAFQEAEAFNGPSLIVAYSHCISHGYNLVHGLEQQKLAVQSGYWPLLRYNPDLTKEGKNPFQLDSKAPSIPLEEYVYNENRYKMLTRINPEVAKKLLKQAQEEVLRRWKMYEYLAALTFEKNK